MPLAFAINAIGFEPEPSEFKKLDAKPQEPWLKPEYLPFGVSGTGGVRTLNVPLDPQSASLLVHNESIGVRFDKTQFFNIQNHIEVETITISDALKLTNLSSIDYLKIDIEGAEREVIGSSATLLDNMLAAKSKVSFLELRHGQARAPVRSIYV